MNLYDYSQQNNIEMGILITKKEDEEAYQALIDEINNIKVNGVRKKFESLNIVEDPSKIVVNLNPLEERKVIKEQITKVIEFTPDQKLKFQILKEWRLYKSRDEKTSAFLILTDDEIKSVVTVDNIDLNTLYDLLPKKKVIKYGEEIFTKIKYSGDYTVGKVISVWYQDNSSSYDRVKLKILNTGEEKWFDTTYELPYKEKLLAVKINKTWFNQYMYLDN